jgi:hypothetical protein
VSALGALFVIDILTADGCLRSRTDLEKDFDAVSAAAAQQPPDGAEASIAALTALKRSHWAQVREEVFSEGKNGRSLRAIESALFFVALSSDSFEQCDWTGRARALLTATSADGSGPPTAWLDKSFSVVIFKDGDFGVHCEHSWADGGLRKRARARA